jgi:AcrR family transcriptional regulator
MAQTDYHHGNLRQALLDAGEKLLETEGAAGLSLRALARETGVSHAAPYRHFADKTDLLAALAARGFARLARVLAETARAYPDAPGREFLTACRRYMELGLAAPAMYRLMFGQPQPGVGGQPELDEAGQAAYDALLCAMARGKAAGVFADAAEDTLAMAVWSMVHGITELAISGRLGPCCQTREAILDFGEQTFRLLLSGLAARSDTP